MSKTETRLTWDEIGVALQGIVNAVSDIRHPKCNAIVPVARGGLVPGVMLSHRLHIPIQCVIHASSYADKGLRYPVKFDGWLPPMAQEKQSRVLIVDDVIDTGSTLHEIAKLYPRACYAVLHRKMNGPHVELPSMRLIVGAEVTATTWLVYPWEI